MWRQVVSLGLLAILCTTYIQGYYFTHYVYAQQWPTPFCESNQHHLKSMSGDCVFNQSISGWTIHGLWPSVNATYPSNCNRTWLLKKSDISGIADEMQAKWPSLSGRESFAFWQHEWNKHGTCATSIPRLYGPYNYFTFTMKLNTKYNMMMALKNSNKRIVPVSDRCYDYKDFASAVQQTFGESIIMRCVWNQKTKQQHIAQIEICFDKSFQFTCNLDLMRTRRPAHYGPKHSHSFHTSPCSVNEAICYFPIPH